jgi:predicted transcriptional regulator of viral defense system
MGEKKYLSEREASIYTGLHRNTLRVLRTEGSKKGRLNYYKVGKKILYVESEIDNFIKLHKV